jgi:hypothetical protein
VPGVLGEQEQDRGPDVSASAAPAPAPTAPPAEPARAAARTERPECGQALDGEGARETPAPTPAAVLVRLVMLMVLVMDVVMPVVRLIVVCAYHDVSPFFRIALTIYRQHIAVKGHSRTCGDLLPVSVSTTTANTTCSC